jgi:hypothetical protein
VRLFPVEHADEMIANGVLRHAVIMSEFNFRRHTQTSLAHDTQRHRGAELHWLWACQIAAPSEHDDA